MNEREEPESIRNLRLCSGNVMYERTLELRLKEIISGVRFLRPFEAGLENFENCHRCHNIEVGH